MSSAPFAARIARAATSPYRTVVIANWHRGNEHHAVKKEPAKTVLCQFI
jgi:hypothetical protein